MSAPEYQTLCVGLNQPYVLSAKFPCNDAYRTCCDELIVYQVSRQVWRLGGFGLRPSRTNRLPARPPST